MGFFHSRAILKPASDEGSPKVRLQSFPFFLKTSKGFFCLTCYVMLVESVCALAHLVQKFKIKSVARTGENVEAFKERILSAKTVITLTPKDCPLRFEAR